MKTSNRKWEVKESASQERVREWESDREMTEGMRVIGMRGIGECKPRESEREWENNRGNESYRNERYTRVQAKREWESEKWPREWES